MSNATAQAPRLSVEVAPRSRQEDPTGPILAAGLVLGLTALVSWLAARYLNWAMAPRRFRLRVAAAGILPLAILVGLLVAVRVSIEDGLLSALASLRDIPSSGRLLMLAMLLTGLLVAWLTARRRDRREAARAIADVEAFE